MRYCGWVIGAVTAVVLAVLTRPVAAATEAGGRIAAVPLPQAVPASADEPIPPAPVAIAPVAAASHTKAPRPAITLQAKADLARQILTLTENGKTIATWPISSGVEDHATPRGTFQPEWTARMWYSHTYDNAPMPNAVFFKDGAAIHATQSTGALGRAASHGCVRLAPGNAAIFYNLVQRHGLAHTRIAVFGTPNYARSPVVSRSRPTERRYASADTRSVYNGGVFGWGNIFAHGASYTVRPVAYRYR